MADSKVDTSILKITEALLFASPEPLTQSKLNQCFERDDINIEKVIEALKEYFREQDRPMDIVSIASGYQLVTQPDYKPYLERLFRKSSSLNLSRAALEALAVIAYKQPVTKGEIEIIRGVGSDSVIKNLLEKELITIRGRDETVGRPLLYGTTPSFLQAFGLNSLGEMPKLKEIKEIMESDETPSPVESHASE